MIVEKPVNFIIGILFLIAFVFGLFGGINPIVSALQVAVGVMNILVGVIGDD